MADTSGRAPGEHGHVPVLLDRCVELLKPALTRRGPDGSGAVLVDATLGAGGHAERFLTELPGLRLIGLDRDPNALWIAGERLAPFADRVLLARTRFDGIEGVLAESGYWASESGQPEIDGILFDLGVSSMQLDRTERGFSYSADAPLDMRMDPDAELTAAEVVNTYDEKSLARILREFGEERFAGRIAARIVRRRARQPFARTGELVELLYEAIPAPARRTGGHPAKRTFQALRVAVNGELDVAARRAACRAGSAGPWRTHRGDVLPVAGGPHRQERVRRGDGVAHAARSARRTPRARTGIREPDPRRRARGRGRDRTQPTKRVRAASGTGKGCRKQRDRLMKAKRPTASARRR